MRIEHVTLPSTAGKDEKAPKVIIGYSNNRGDVGSDIVEYASSDEPLRSFRAAMQQLQVDVVEIIGFMKDDAGDITIRAVAIKYKEGVRGLVIGATKHVKGARIPFNFTTPYLEQAKDGEDHVGFMSKKLNVKLDVIIAEAVKYIDGERAQSDMFEHSGAPPVREGDPEVPPAPEPQKGKKAAGKARNSKLASKKLKLHVSKP